MKILHLTLKKKWFDMILSGEKTEEYREIKEYWFKRFTKFFKKIFKYCTGYNWDDGLFRQDGINFITTKKRDLIEFKHYNIIRFRNGYSKDAPSFYIELKSISLGYTKKGWSDNEGEFCYVLTLGKILSS